LKKKTKTKQELPLEMEEFQSRLNVAEERLEEANELMQAENTAYSADSGHSFRRNPAGCSD